MSAHSLQGHPNRNLKGLRLVFLDPSARGTEAFHALVRAEDSDCFPGRQTRKGKAAEVTRFKGLGEMGADVINLRTMDPATRSMLRVGLDHLGHASPVFDTVVGKDTRKRFTFIKENALEVGVQTFEGMHTSADSG